MKVLLILLYILETNIISAYGENFDRNPNNNNYRLQKRQIFDIFPSFGSCVTYEGRSGRCQVSQFGCSRLSADRPRLSCSVLGFPGICCPDTDEKPVLPPQTSVACGQRYFNQTNSQFLIVGGTEAQPQSWPWAVQLYRRSTQTGNFNFICGASILNELYVLCAAHCISTTNPNDYRVKIGAYRISDTEEFINISQVIPHEGYAKTGNQNDIALFRLKSRITWRPGVAPVCLPTQPMFNMNITGSTAWLIGWGTTFFGSSSVSNNLREVTVPIVSNDECDRAYNNFLTGEQITAGQVCAGLPEGGKDTCQGDSGGPMTLQINGIFYQFGVVSYGNGCAKRGWPGVYTRVPFFEYWIGAKMENDSKNGSI